MGARTTEKGEIGEAMVIADLIKQGHDIAIPFGHNLPFDLIVVRKENGNLEKVQVKYRTSNGIAFRASVRSASAWVRHRYTAAEVDWVAVYDATTDRCYYVHSSVWDGQGTMNLPVVPTANGQKKFIRYADSFTSLGSVGTGVSSRSADDPPLPFDTPPE